MVARLPSSTRSTVQSPVPPNKNKATTTKSPEVSQFSVNGVCRVEILIHGKPPKSADEEGVVRIQDD